MRSSAPCPDAPKVLRRRTFLSLAIRPRKRGSAPRLRPIPEGVRAVLKKAFRNQLRRRTLSVGRGG